MILIPPSGEGKAIGSFSIGKDETIMENLKNSCTFIGRVYGSKYSTVNMGGEEVKKVMLNLIVNKNLSKEQREKAKNDSSIKTAEFVPMSATGSTAQYIETYFPDGKAAVVKATYATYTRNNSKSGEKEYGHIFNIEKIDFLPTDKADLGSNSSSNSSSNNSSSNNSGFNMFEETSSESAPW